MPVPTGPASPASRQSGGASTLSGEKVEHLVAQFPPDLTLELPHEAEIDAGAAVVVELGVGRAGFAGEREPGAEAADGEVAVEHRRRQHPGGSFRRTLSGVSSHQRPS